MHILYNTLYVLVIGAIIAFGLLLVVGLVPIPGNIEVKIVQSGSMEPAISTGALTIIRPIANYAVGDVITFGPDTKTRVPTTHRIVASEVLNGTTYYTTKGDANEDPDPRQVAQSAVIGKVLFSIPYLGFLLDFAKKPIGFALLIGVPAAIIIFDEVGKIWNEVRATKRKEEEEKKEKENA